MFKTRLSIKRKILIGFTALILFFIANVAYIFYTIENSRYIVTNLFEDKDQSVVLLNDFKDLVLRSKMYSLNWVFQRKDEEGKTILKQLLTEEFPLVKENFEKSATIWSSKEQLSQIDKVLLDFEFLKDSEEEIMMKLAKFTDYNDFVVKAEADDILESSIIPQSNKILAKIDDLLLQKKKEKQIAQQSILEAMNNLVSLLIFSIVVVVPLGFVLSLYASNHISTPIIALKEVVDALGKGEQPKLVEIVNNDEIGDMERSVNKLIIGLNHTSGFAENIGKGNFDSPFSPLSGKDILGNALIEMRNNLRTIAEEDKKRYWANEGSAMFSDMLRYYNSSIEDLATHILASLVKFMNANQGSFFVINDENTDDIHLSLVAAYAWNKRKMIKKRIDIGEGAVGQAWIEKDMLFITDIPNNYIHITSGLGDSNPRCIVIVPLIFNGEVFGVIELASFHIFEKHEVAFLKKLVEDIASTISTVKSNTRTAYLLEESQMMSEQLRTQEEEMRQNLEELMATQDTLQSKADTYEKQIQTYNTTTVK